MEDGYHQNPYHNAVHAADVTQAVNCFMLETKVIDLWHCHGVSGQLLMITTCRIKPAPFTGRSHKRRTNLGVDCFVS